jgi:cell division protein FtsQ
MNATQTPVLPLRLSPRMRVLALLGSLLLLAGGLWAAAQQTARPAARLSVSGLGERVSAAEVHQALRDQLAAPISRLDLDALRASVLALPWVSHARVERVWPDGLHVRIWERRPIARWGSDALLDTDADVFTPRPSEIASELPQLDGPSGSALDVMQRYLGLAEAIAPSGLRLVGLALDLRGEWVARLAPGIPVRFGRGDPLERVPVLVGPVQRVIAGRLHEVERIDLRYTNGFAVRWQTSADPQGEANG